MEKRERQFRVELGPTNVRFRDFRGQAATTVLCVNVCAGTLRVLMSACLRIARSVPSGMSPG